MDATDKAQEILQGLHYNFTAFTLEDFLLAAGRAKGRILKAFACDLPTDVLGGWLTDDAAPMEYIFYKKDLPEIQQIHIQLHEVSHFLMGHETRRINRQALIQAEDQGPALILGEILQLRSNISTVLEVEAETLASLIQKQVIRHSNMGLLTQNKAPFVGLTDFLKDMGK